MPRKSTKKPTSVPPAVVVPQPLAPMLPSLDDSVNYAMPTKNLIALGKLLYVKGDVREDGLTEGDDKLLDESFQMIDEFLTKTFGPDWLGDLEEPENETPGYFVKENI